MSQDVNRQWLLKSRPEREVGPEHFDWVETPVPEPREGEILVRNLCLSFEPAQRGWLNDLPSYVPPVRIGEPMRAVAVGRVVESRHPLYRAGDLVQGTFGWQDYIATDGAGMFPISPVPAGVPLTYPLHIYGLTGMTAYFGMTRIAEPRPGDIVVVSGAAGATGSVAGQIAKRLGCTVIGIAGGEEKCRWLVEEVNFDHAIDYRAGEVAAQLKSLCGNRVNVFFDNVGGEILDAVLINIAIGARIALCGGISSGYFGRALPPGPRNYMQLVIRRARMQGFLVLDYLDEFPAGIAEMRRWVEAGEIRVKEDIAQGLENCPEVLNGLFKGRNFGKQLLKIADP